VRGLSFAFKGGARIIRVRIFSVSEPERMLRGRINRVAMYSFKAWASRNRLGYGAS